MGERLRTYHDALDFLYARTTGKWKLGLERVEELLRALGDPHRQLRATHVAGTNGKGSVCATLDAVLRAGGHKVARYTSPHLIDFRERFLVDGAPVASERIVGWVQRWTPEVERLGATFFEATTAMAFDFFAQDGVDIAVIETGLGGRLDATNVLVPLVAGVTNIQIDHVEYLGATREEIAFEKAGIFKAGVPAIIGEPEPGIRALLAQHARGHAATPVQCVFDETVIDEMRVAVDGTHFVARYGNVTREVHTPLVGRHQASNALVALAMLEALPPDLRPSAETIRRGMRAVELPGRFQRVAPYVLDVAHNPDGATVLARTLAEVDLPRPIVAVFSVLADKDWGAMMAALAPQIDAFVLTNTPTAPTARAWNLPEVEGHARATGVQAVMVRDFDRALGKAIEMAGNGGGRGEGMGSGHGGGMGSGHGMGTVLITGSFHTVGDAMSRLSIGVSGG